MKFELLADNYQECKTVAKWYYDEWASKVPGVSLANVEGKVSSSTHRDKAPLIILAKNEGNGGNKGIVVGAAELKKYEMNIYPEYEFWLCGVYVEPLSRGQGIGKRLTQKILDLARTIGISKLYLQTEHKQGGLYREHGFKALESVVYNGREVLVMVAKV